MITSKDTLEYKRIGFDNDRYLSLQREKIIERIDHFSKGRLYLEIGGKTHYDPHAARVLPGYLPDNKITLLKKLSNISELAFCMNSNDIIGDRQLDSNARAYREEALTRMIKLEELLGQKPKIIITLCDYKNPDERVARFRKELEDLGYEVAQRYFIDGYPEKVKRVVSEKGYGRDEYIEFSKPLVIITGAASNSGKLSTALGQIYQDHQKKIKSGYAKWETFPIWGLPLNHPVNLAYEAATADIGDYNVIDTYHQQAYGKRTVNYNRDVEAFEIIKNISDKIVSDDNHMKDYKSPTDMGINLAGQAIVDDEVVCVASLREIRRRANWFTEITARGDGNKKWIQRCLDLEKKARRYINDQGYDPDIAI